MAASDEVRGYLRLEAGPEDALVDALVAAAIATGEAFLGQVILRRTIAVTLPASPAWTRIGATPVQAITLVEGLAADGGAVVLPVDGYAIDIDAAGDGWVRVTAPGAARVRVTLTAGMAADWTGVPAGIAQGIVRLAAHLFQHRDDGVGPPAAIAALWRPWRRMRLGGSRAA